MSSGTAGDDEHIDKEPKINLYWPRHASWLLHAYRYDRGDFSDIVEVRVGEKKKPFQVHKSVLCNSAQYFQAALNGNFAESRTQILELVEDNAEIFEHFLVWLYTGQIIPGFQAGDDGVSAQEVLVQLYIFGEARGIPKFQDSVMDQLIDQMEKSPSISNHLLPAIYDGTPIGSPLRRVYTDYIALEGELIPHEWFKPECKRRHPRESLIDLIGALYKIKRDCTCTRKTLTELRDDYHVEISEGDFKASSEATEADKKWIHDVMYHG